MNESTNRQQHTARMLLRRHSANTKSGGWGCSHTAFAVTIDAGIIVVIIAVTIAVCIGAVMSTKRAVDAV